MRYQEEGKETQIRVGDNIRHNREALGWSQKMLADMANLEMSHVGKIERGEVEAKIGTLCKIATAMRVSSDRLLFAHDPETDELEEQTGQYRFCLSQLEPEARKLHHRQTIDRLTKALDEPEGEDDEHIIDGEVLRYPASDTRPAHPISNEDAATLKDKEEVRNLRYSLVREWVETSDGESAYTYGIVGETDAGMERVACRDISTDRQGVEWLIRLMNTYSLAPCHFMDVVEDFVDRDYSIRVLY